MTLEKDTGRDLKKLGLLAGLAFIVLAGGFLLLSWLNQPAPAPSRISLDKTAGGGRTRTAESPQYRALLDKYNADNAQQTAASGGTYIASVHTDTEPLPRTQTPPPAHVPPKPAPRTGRAQPSGLSETRQKAVDTLLKSLSTQWDAPHGQLAGTPDGQISGGADNSGNGNAGAAVQTVSAFSGWTDSLTPQAPAGMTQTAAVLTATADRELIAAGTRAAAVIDNLVDSDNRRSRVTAHIPAGKYAGAVFLSHDVQLAGDGVSIHFTEMSWRGTNYAVDVWAEQQDTLAGNVASEVDHHYVSRIIVPAIAHGIGNAGRLYEDANTEILSTQYGEVTANVDSPDAEAVTGTILGGMADKAGQVIERDAANVPATQVKVWRNEPVSLLFMKPVRESDSAEASLKAARTPVQTQIPPTGRTRQQPAVTSPQPATYRSSRFPRRSDNNYGNYGY